MSQKTVGIIGFGNMGSAIAERIKAKYRVWVFDKDKTKTKNLTNIDVAQDIVDLVNQVEFVILAVKPQDFDSVLDGIKNFVKDKLIISIAAGITTSYIEKRLDNVRVIRVMPNIGVKIGEAESVLCKGRYADDNDLSFVQELFGSLGRTWVFPEGMINPSTAITGSGPAYIFYAAEKEGLDPKNIPYGKGQEYSRRLAKTAEAVGFDSQTAKELAVTTSITSIHLMEKTGFLPGELRRQVTSPGGTTEAALMVLENNGSWEKAAEAALKRAEELSRG